MTEVSEHYSKHLGPIYSWLVGGLDRAVALGEAELNALAIPVSAGTIAVDLGAGIGMHAIPLGRRGYSVVAIDSCAVLLEKLETQKGLLPIRYINADLSSFHLHVSDKARLIMCMGDTICHLPDVSAIRELIAHIAVALEPRGTFVASFRDYTTELPEDGRFIPVRHDDTRILTCFLEYDDTHVRVHDLLHERSPEGWKLAVSNYRKVRLSPTSLIEILQQTGYSAVQQPGLSGMVRIVATLCKAPDQAAYTS